MRARDPFAALWTPDLFMERVEANAEWSLFCPNECPDFTTHTVTNSSTLRQVRIRGPCKKNHQARELWDAITQSQIETQYSHVVQGRCATRSPIRRTWNN